MNGWAVFLIILLLILLAGGGGYVLYAHYRARKLGLPPPNFNPFNKKPRQVGGDPNYRAPAPAPGGIQGWVTDKWHTLTSGSGRSAGGAYESTGYGGARRGFGPLDPDEAWDARVDNDGPGGYYEEQELGLQDPMAHGPYGGGGYGGGGSGAGYGNSGSHEEDRGRGRSRDGRLNPFGDGAEESSLRSVSPRPELEGKRVPSHTQGQSSLGTAGSGGDDSPTERRSMFREDV